MEKTGQSISLCLPGVLFLGLGNLHDWWSLVHNIENSGPFSVTLLSNKEIRDHCWNTLLCKVTLDHISATVTYVRQHEKYLQNIIGLQRVHFSIPPSFNGLAAYYKSQQIICHCRKGELQWNTQHQYSQKCYPCASLYKKCFK